MFNHLKAGYPPDKQLHGKLQTIFANHEKICDMGVLTRVKRLFLKFNNNQVKSQCRSSRSSRASRASRRARNRSRKAKSRRVNRLRRSRN